MTSLQMVQFVGIMVHGFQLLFTESCGFPWQYGLYIAAHAVMFFILFSQFYIKEYFVKSRRSRVSLSRKGSFFARVHYSTYAFAWSPRPAAGR